MPHQLEQEREEVIAIAMLTPPAKKNSATAVAHARSDAGPSSEPSRPDCTFASGAMPLQIMPAARSSLVRIGV